MDRLYEFTIKLSLRLQTKAENMFIEQEADIMMHSHDVETVELNAFPIIANQLLQQGVVLRKLEITDIIQGKEITADSDAYQKWLDTKDQRLEFTIKK